MGNTSTDTISETTDQKGQRKKLLGVVVSDCQEKTIIIRVDRKIQHQRYGKVVVRSKKFHVHDEKNEAKIGDIVRISETRPISKLKRWRLLEVVKRAEIAAPSEAL